MPAYKDKKTGLFYVQFYYRDARGAKQQNLCRTLSGQARFIQAQEAKRISKG